MASVERTSVGTSEEDIQPPMKKARVLATVPVRVLKVKHASGKECCPFCKGPAYSLKLVGSSLTCTMYKCDQCDNYAPAMPRISVNRCGACGKPGEKFASGASWSVKGSLDTFDFDPAKCCVDED